MVGSKGGSRTQEKDQMHALEQPVRAYCREELKRIIDTIRAWVLFKVLLISSSAEKPKSADREKDKTKTAGGILLESCEGELERW